MTGKKNFFLRGDFTPFYSYFFILRPLLSLKVLDIQLREVGAQRRLDGTLKVNTHTDNHTHRQTYGQWADALKIIKTNFISKFGFFLQFLKC